MKNLLSTIFRYLEIDETVTFSLITKLWSIASGIISLWLILSKFSITTQAYYYTFSSILGINLFFELGLAPVLQNYASHEWSKLQFNYISNKLEGDQESINRLSSVFKFCFKWFCYASILYFVFLIIGGFYFFNKINDQNFNWILPWLVVSLLSSCNFIFTPVWALLEGCNQVNKLYKFRLIQIVVVNIFLWIAIYFGSNLWSTSISISVSMILSIIFLINNFKSFLYQILINESNKINSIVKKEFHKLQTKSALNSFGNYFSYSFFTPIIIKNLGTSDAAKFGITFSIISLFGNFSTSILTPKLPSLAIYAAQKNHELLNINFFKILKSAMFILSIVCMIFLLFININFLREYRYKLLSNELIILLCLSQFLQTVSIFFGSYMRAFKKEEVVFITIFQSLLVLTSTYFFSKYYTLYQLILSYFGISVLTITLVYIKWKNFTKNLD